MGGVLSIGLTAIAFSAASYGFRQIDKDDNDASRDRHYRKEEEIQQEKLDDDRKRQQHLDSLNHKKRLQKEADETLVKLDEDETIYANTLTKNKFQPHQHVLSEYYTYNNEHHIKDTLLIGAITIITLIVFHYFWKHFY